MALPEISARTAASPLSTLYDEIRGSARLAGVQTPQTFGDAAELDKPGSSPRMVWIPTRGRQHRADTLKRANLVIAGVRAQATSIALVARGVDIHLFTDFGPDGQRQMEALLNELQVALHETLLSFSNYEVGEEVWAPRGPISQKTIEVLLPVRLYVPIWQAQPGQLLGAVKTNLT